MISTADYAVFAVFLFIPIIIGTCFACRGGKQKTTTEFLMADKNITSWLIALSLASSYFSSVSLLGTAAEVYTYGLQYIVLVMFAYWIVAGAVHVLMIPMFHRAKVISVNEYLEVRFTPGVRLIGFTIFSLTYLLFLCLVLYIPSQALETVAGVPLVASIVSSGIVCTVYSAVGGLKAVVWTNVFHLTLMVVGLVTFCIMGTISAGGFDNVININREHQRLTIFDFNPDPTVRNTFWTLAIGGALRALPTCSVGQVAVQRYMSTKFVALARRALWVSVPVVMAITGLACLSGFVIYAVYANCDLTTQGEIQGNEQVLVYFVANRLRYLQGMPGLMTACIFASSLSFISSGLNSVTLVLLEDVVRKKARNLNDFESTKCCKVITVILGALVIGGALSLHHAGELVIEVFYSLTNITGGSLLGVFTLGMLIPRANSRGAYLGVVSGLAMTIWLFTGSQLYPPNKRSAPVSISECPVDVFNRTEAATFNDTGIRYPLVHRQDNPMATFYSMSYLWYSAIGWSVTMIIGTLTSMLLETAEERKAGVDPKVIFPLKAWLLSWLPSNRKMWNSSTGLPHSDDKEDWVQLGERKQPGSTEQIPNGATRDSWRASMV